MTRTLGERFVAIVAGLLLASAMVSCSRGSDRGTEPSPGGAYLRGPIEREQGPADADREGWIESGVASIEDVIAAKGRPATEAGPGSMPLTDAPAQGPSCPTPCLTTGFKTNDNRQDVTPADPAGAAGMDHVVAAVNISVGVWSRSGTLEIGPRRLDKLFPATHMFPFDPKVIYDQFHQTFVLVFLGTDYVRDSWIFTVAIPEATATDPGTWCKRRIAGDRLADGIAQMADYPGVGYDGSRVYVATNMFDFSERYYGTQVLALPAKGLYDCGAPLKFRTFNGTATRNPDGSRSASIQPATVGGSTKPSAEYMVSFDYSCRSGDCKGDTAVLWRITKGPAGLRLARASVGVGTARMPPFGTQKGAKSINSPTFWWDTGDLRLTNACYDADLDRLYTAHAVERNFGSNDYVESAARWYELAPAAGLGNSTLTRSGYVGAPGLDLGWPTVATESDGTMFMTVSGAGYPADSFLSIYATTVQPGTDVPDALVQVHPGTAAYNWGPGYERWGDYNQINRDPADGAAVWTFNQVATGAAGFDEFADRLTDI